LAIDFGRKGFATRGKEQEGRISYETGIAAALSTFRDALSTADPQTIILVEYTFLKDSFHTACIAHRTRLQNILRTPGVDPIEKALLKQRFTNLAIAQNGYIEKQKTVLTK
jgi:hypothetical protein